MLPSPLPSGNLPVAEGRVAAAVLAAGTVAAASKAAVVVVVVVVVAVVVEAVELAVIAVYRRRSRRRKTLRTCRSGAEHAAVAISGCAKHDTSSGRDFEHVMSVHVAPFFASSAKLVHSAFGLVYSSTLTGKGFNQECGIWRLWRTTGKSFDSIPLESPPSCWLRHGQSFRSRQSHKQRCLSCKTISLSTYAGQIHFWVSPILTKARRARVMGRPSGYLGC